MAQLVERYLGKVKVPSPILGTGLYKTCALCYTINLLAVNQSLKAINTKEMTRQNEFG